MHCEPAVLMPKGALASVIVYRYKGALALVTPKGRFDSKPAIVFRRARLWTYIAAIAYR
jgi:hypothetical protein